MTMAMWSPRAPSWMPVTYRTWGCPPWPQGSPEWVHRPSPIRPAPRGEGDAWALQPSHQVTTSRTYLQYYDQHSEQDPELADLLIRKHYKQNCELVKQLTEVKKELVSSHVILYHGWLTSSLQHQHKWCLSLTAHDDHGWLPNLASQFWRWWSYFQTIQYAHAVCWIIIV